MDSIKATLRDYILATFLQGDAKSNLRDETPLRTSGIIDSLGTIQLVTFVEDTFGIELEAHETGVEHFDRIQDLATLISERLARS